VTHKETRSIRDLVSDTANRKHRAAQARSAGTPPGTESPRDVYLSACATIAAAFESSGYQYAKSGPHLRKRSGDFTAQISFQSSHNNVPGEHVCLWIHGTIFSRRIKKWREQQPHVTPSDYVAGGQIGNLQTSNAWLEWELADPNERDSAIDGAISTIKQLAIPYFSLFDDLPSLTSRLIADDFPSMTIDRVIEFLMCFNDQQVARTSAANFLQRRPELIPSYCREFQNYAERGLDSVHPSGCARQLAFASHAFGFGVLAETNA
jgi:hypothetical protein